MTIRNYDNPAETNKVKIPFPGLEVRIIYRQLNRCQRSLDKLLKRRVLTILYEMPDAGHTWYAWRYYLSEKFLPFLWK
jgi:hypothetical protein